MPGGNGIPGGGAPFDVEKIRQMLEDRSIKEAAEAIASDPAFKQMQENMASQIAKMQQSGQALGAGPSSAAELQQMMMQGGVPGGGMMGQGVDPQQAMQAMEGVMKNPAFAQMAQKLGEQMMQDPTMQSMMSEMNNPETTRKMKEKMDKLKEEINHLKSEIHEIKHLLKELVGNHS